MKKLALFALALLASPALVAQGHPIRHTLATIQFSGVPGTDCGDEFTVIGTFGEPTGTNVPFTLDNVEVALPIPAALEISSGVIPATFPFQPAPIVLSGAPGDTEIRFRVPGTYCFYPCGPNGENSGFSYSFRVRIRNPNAATSATLQAIGRADAFVPLPSDWLATPAAADPLVLAWPACPGADPGPTPTPRLEAFLSDTLIIDHDADGAADAGDRVRYTALLRNTGSATAPAATYTSPLDPSSRLVIGSVSTTAGAITAGNSAGDTTVRVSGWTAGPTTVVVTYDADVLLAPLSQTHLAVQGSFSAQNALAVPTDDPNTVPLLDPTLTPIDFDPDLALTKNDGGATAAPGGAFTYTFTVANPGPLQATGSLSDSLPNGLTALPNDPASSPGWSCSGANCNLSISPPLPPAGSTVRTLRVAVANTFPAGTASLLNSATLTVAGDTNLSNNSDTETTPLAAAPDLAVAKDDGGAVAAPGGTVSYALTVRNLGSQGATGVVLTDTLPAGTTLAPSSSGWSCSGTTCTRVLGPLAAAATATASITLSVPLSATGTLTNTVVVSDDGANGTDTDPSNNSATDTTPVASPEITLAKSLLAIDLAPPTPHIDYRITVANVGAINVDVTLTESPPFPLDLPNSPGWACSVLPCSYFATLTPGQTVNADLRINLPLPIPPGLEEVTNCVTGQAVPGPVNGGVILQSCVTTAVPAGPDLRITKDDGGASAAPGDDITYTLSVTNDGNQVATGIVLVDTLPNNATIRLEASPGWSCDPASCSTLIAGNLAPGETVAREITLTATEAGTILNTATVSDDGSGGADPTPGNNTDTDTTPVALSVAASKDDLIPLSDTRGAGDEITYLVSFAPNGTVPSLRYLARNPVAVRLIPGTVTTTSGTITAGNAAADATVEILTGPLSAGETVTVTYKAVIDDPLDPTLEFAAWEGVVYGPVNVEATTDDPETFEYPDPTRTRLAHVAPRAVPDIPTLNQLGLIALALALAALGFLVLRTRS